MSDPASLADDRQAIVDLTIAYCWAIDGKRFDELDAVFIPDAHTVLGENTVDGLDAIKQFIARVLGPLDGSQHMISNHEVSLDGDRGTCRCYLHAQHIRASAQGGGPHFVVAGRYEDVVVRTPVGWRIAERYLVPMWTEGNSAVLHP